MPKIILHQHEKLLNKTLDNLQKRFNIIIEKIKNNIQEEVKLDNKINSNIYEDNIDFSNFTSDIKLIAIYIPTFYNLTKKEDIKIAYGWENIRNAKPIFTGHNQPRKPIEKNKYLGYYDLTDIDVIKKQIQVAKSHGIYGFCIYYYWVFGRILFDKFLKLIYKNKDIDFKFLLIWKNDYYLSEEKKNSQENKLDNNKENKLIKNYNNLIEDIEIYLKDSRYIKINKKPVIGIYKPLIINSLEKVIFTWRKKAREKNIGEIFILVNLNRGFSKIFKKQNLSDAAYEFPPFNILSHNLMKNKNFFYYSGIIYRTFNKPDNITNDYPIYKGVMLEWDNSPIINENFYIFNEYSPEKFYIILKLSYNSQNSVKYIFNI